MHGKKEGDLADIMELPPDFVLRAGRGDGSAPPDPQFVLGVSSTLCVFCEAAMREAGEYAVAAGRRVWRRRIWP